LGHCATSREVAGSIPDSVIGIFHLHNPSGCAMALGSTYPLTEMSIRNIFLGLTTLPSSCTDCLEIWELQPPGTLRAYPGLYRDCFTVIRKHNRMPHTKTTFGVCITVSIFQFLRKTLHALKCKHDTQTQIRLGNS